MPSVIVVPLGPGDPSLLTLGAMEALTNARALVLRTGIHDAVPFLKEKSIDFATMDELYGKCEDFDKLNDTIARLLWQWAADMPITYAVADPATDETVRALYRLRPEAGEITVLGGVTEDSLYRSRAIGEAGDGGIRVFSAVDAVSARPVPEETLLVTELNSRIMVGSLKLHLMDLYPPEWQVLFFPDGKSAPVPLPLCELDRQNDYDHTSAVLIPPCPFDKRQRFDTLDLLNMVKLLRSPDGCPWDRAQNHESILTCITEEAYEIRDAIERQDDDDLCKELGDMMFNVLFHCVLAEEQSVFNLLDVTSNNVEKMIRRHPHVFGSMEKPADAVSQVAVWDQLKEQQRGNRTVAESLDGIPKCLPALMLAQKILHRCGEGVCSLSMEDTLGGRLLSLCAEAERNDLNAEEELLNAARRVRERLTRMENAILADKKRLKDLTKDEIAVYWRACEFTKDNPSAT